MRSDTFEKGLKVRKEVLGSDFVEDSFSNASEFSKPLQELVTEFCFGAVWDREGLSRRDRSLINIALLAASGRAHALHHHVQAAIGNGASEEEIRETLVHVIPYAGFYHGKAEAQKFFETVLSSIDINQFDPEEMLSAEDKVIVTGHLNLTTKSTGREIDSDFVHVITLKDGKWLRFRDFMNTAVAVAAFS